MLAICPTFTTTGAALIVKLAGDAVCDGDTTSTIAEEMLPFVIASPA